MIGDVAYIFPTATIAQAFSGVKIVVILKI
jgi:hypothetical protein